ncbi:hypothetical protein LCL96_15385 [Rossellomorea aquimaris]|uniref:hypothetical protein n=1 Tax=Rossellomorea TaxID=2837508 RepID=UPI001CD5DCBE|nr:hypothetical protein [Rossellomorea aquimaris]MCA1060321.1 hypothetical protein [Rossellomorea aquimaris]
MRIKIICSILVTVGLLFAYIATKSNDWENTLGYSFVAIIGFVDAYLFWKHRDGSRAS